MASHKPVNVTIKIGEQSDDGKQEFLDAVVDYLNVSRHTDIRVSKSTETPTPSCLNVLGIVEQLIQSLQSGGHDLEAEALRNAYEKCTSRESIGGFGYRRDAILAKEQEEEVLFQVQAYIESLSSQERARDLPPPVNSRDSRTAPMTLAQKIFAHHVLGERPITGLEVGDAARVAVDWIIASEASWMGMCKTLNQLGQPAIFRNDRFWLAGDHVYDPRIAHVPKVAALRDAAEKAKRDFRLTEYQGMNYTIMHTEFVRERAEPGMLILGSDSHTCSSGAVGCLAIGLGAADVAIGLISGETWFKIPESILINFTGQPAFGIGGKDVILHVLRKLKRNTVASDRIVEFTGEGLKWLSIDARFAISNMCTEFGAVTGVFTADKITRDYIARRRRKANKANSIYFKADEGAQYAGVYEINLSEVEPTIALYPNPDDVVPVSSKVGMPLDGVFIGACTTAEEDLVLAALVLKAGLDSGWKPSAKGKRHVVPGSLPIVEKLERMGLLQVYEDAGFTRGPPGCSYCVGMGADRAGEGETWLSSQNRNFKNRMGKGSFGNLSSAAVCAASAFSMTVTDPTPLLKKIDLQFFSSYKNPIPAEPSKPIKYMEPRLGLRQERKPPTSPTASNTTTRAAIPTTEDDQLPPSDLSIIESKIVRLGDFIDTDALAPADILLTATTDAALATHCLAHTHPTFRAAVREKGHRVLVAGHAFGCGSSREEAVRALRGLGLAAVLAPSFAFIHARNQPALGLLGLVVPDDPVFFAVARDGAPVRVDVPARTVRVGTPGDGAGEGRAWPVRISEMEYRLTLNRGVERAWRRFGARLWERMTEKVEEEKEGEEGEGKLVRAVAEADGLVGGDRRLEW